MLISDDRIERALRFLHECVDLFAEAKANRVALEKSEKGLLALWMKESGEKTAEAQKREAYASQNYTIHVDGLKEAIKAEERLEGRREFEKMICELWRTQQANNRTTDRVR